MKLTVIAEIEIPVDLMEEFSVDELHEYAEEMIAFDLGDLPLSSISKANPFKDFVDFEYTKVRTVKEGVYTTTDKKEAFWDVYKTASEKARRLREREDAVPEQKRNVLRALVEASERKEMAAFHAWCDVSGIKLQ